MICASVIIENENMMKQMNIREFSWLIVFRYIQIQFAICECEIDDEYIGLMIVIMKCHEIYQQLRFCCRFIFDLIRKKIFGQGDPRFRMRGEKIHRIENFSDAVFAFLFHCSSCRLKYLKHSKNWWRLWLAFYRFSPPWFWWSFSGMSRTVISGITASMIHWLFGWMLRCS